MAQADSSSTILAKNWLGIATEKAVTGDLNDDGFPDFAIIVNQEFPVWLNNPYLSPQKIKEDMQRDIKMSLYVFLSEFDKENLIYHPHYLMTVINKTVNVPSWTQDNYYIRLKILPKSASEQKVTVYCTHEYFSACTKTGVVFRSAKIGGDTQNTEYYTSKEKIDLKNDGLEVEIEDAPNKHLLFYYQGESFYKFILAND